MTRYPDDLITVTDRHGSTIMQRPAGPSPKQQHAEAIRAAAQAQGKVFVRDRHGFLTRTWPER